MIFSEIGSGEGMKRDVLSYESVMMLDWGELLKARGGTGDLPIALVHAQRGELVRKLVTASSFAHAERELRAGWARMLERQHHPEQCGLSEVDVIMTDDNRIPGIAVPRRKRRH